MTLLSFFRSKPTHKKQYDEDDQDDANDTDPTVAVAVAAEAATEATKHRASLARGGQAARQRQGDIAQIALSYDISHQTISRLVP